MLEVFVGVDECCPCDGVAVPAHVIDVRLYLSVHDPTVRVARLPVDDRHRKVVQFFAECDLNFTVRHRSGEGAVRVASLVLAAAVPTVETECACLAGGPDGTGVVVENNLPALLDVVQAPVPDEGEMFAGEQDRNHGAAPGVRAVRMILRIRDHPTHDSALRGCELLNAARGNG